jgi:DNA (cytosine-5)-methyltransferase 1
VRLEGTLLVMTGQTIGSLCSGYGGLDIAVAVHHGATVAWHAEVDRHANAVLAHHWPDVPNLGDLTSTDWAAVEPVDILTAGYPCQPFSTAGHRRGTDDPRHLWPHIAAAVRHLRPRRIVLENVAGHLRLGFDSVLADLAALGFDARWGTVRAADAGAPHRRERLFVVADAHSQLLDRTRPERQAGWGEPANGDLRTVLDRWAAVVGRPAPTGTDGRSRLNPAFVEWMMGLPQGWVTDMPGIPHGAQLKLLGNGVVPQQAALALHLLDRP